MFLNRNLITAQQYATTSSEASGIFDLESQSVLKQAGRWPGVVTTTYEIQYTIANAGTTFELQDSGTVSYDVDWGDGSTVETVTTADKSHTYASAGIYTVKLDTTGKYYPYYNDNTNGNQIWAVTIDATADLGSTLSRAFRGLYNMTSFVCPSAATSGIEFMSDTWRDCQALTSFPLLNTSTCKNFPGAWRDCSSLSTFPANSFNSTETLNAGAFSRSWEGCALTAQSIENILTSLDTNGSSNITLDIDGGTNAAYSTWSTAAQTALTNLTNKGWTVAYNT